MRPTVVQQMRRSVWHTATRWQSQTPRILARGLATQAPSTASHAVTSVHEDNEPAEEQQQQTRKATNSNKYFNLMSVQQPRVDSDAGTPASKKLKKKNWYKHRPKKSKWWADMDRVSFRTLLTEEMGSKKVSSVLRKYIDEFPILDNHWSDQELVMIVCALIKMNRSEVALEVLRNQIKEPNRERLNRVAAASARLGNAPVALGVLDITNHFNMVPDVITFTSAIHACARGGKFDVPMALNLLNDMISAQVEPNARTYGAVILAYARLECWEQIENLVNSISYTDNDHKAEVFTCAIISCSRNQQHQYASRLFQLLLEDGVYPGDNVCNAALSSCARTSDLPQLRRTFKLVERHTTPSVYSYNCMISAYGNAGNLDGALEVFESMRRDDVVAPDCVTFNSLLGAAVRSRRADMFPFILSLMSESGFKWDAYTLNILLEGCALSGDVALAEHYWARAQGKERSSELSEEKQHVTVDRGHFELLMTVYYAAKDYQAIVDLWQKEKVCRRRAKSSKSLNFLIRACEGLQDDKTAVALLAEFADRGQPLSSITHHHMLEVFLSADNYSAAVAYLHKMIAMDGLVSTFAFTVTMKYLMKNNRHSDVLTMFELYLKTREASIKGQNPLLHYPADVIYVMTMRSAVELQDHETVLSIYDELPVPMSMAVRTELLVLAVSSCEREGDWRAAVTMYDEMTGKLDEATNVELYKHIVKIVASAGEFDRALDVGGGQWYRQNRPDRGWGLNDE